MVYLIGTKFTRLQKFWLMILLMMNPIFIAGAMSFISKQQKETFTELAYFLMGAYTLYWILILISYIIRKDKLVKEYKPRTTQKLIDETWEQHRKEKELKK